MVVFDRTVSGVSLLLVSISTAQSCVRQIKALCAKTDEDLAVCVRTRQGIVEGAYRDAYYF